MLRCSTPDCPDSIVLRRRSPAGISVDPFDPSKDRWPLYYQCALCENLTEFRESNLQAHSAEELDRTPYTKSLVCYSLLYAHEQTERLREIHAKDTLTACTADEMLATLVRVGLCPEESQAISLSLSTRFLP